MMGTEFLKNEPLVLKLCYLVAAVAFLANTLLFFSTGEINAYLGFGANVILIIFIIRLVTRSGYRET